MRIVALILFSTICAVLLGTYSLFPPGNLWKYIFSLGALYTGFQFFRRNEERGLRIAFVVVTIVLFFVFAVIFSLIQTAQQLA